MKIVVIGGTGLIGSALVSQLTEQGHEAVAASPGTGVDAVTGEGLAAALAGAAATVDVSNARSLQDAAVLDFFETSTRNLLAAGAAAGVGHHVALSVVGADRLTESGYFRAKVAQETLVARGPIPFSVVRATQFFEFMAIVAATATDGATVRLPQALVQPIAAEDVAAAVGRIALGRPVNGLVEIAGPEQFALADVVRRRLRASGHAREVVADPGARYFGAALAERALLPGDGADIAATRFEDWLSRRRTPVAEPDR